ncbi:MAG TPA: polysaccharide biosynthesis C-terminal domain-containing protein, partial [Methanosarcina sp.]|nr:polysaccharide biosynthesis C-terminal domain-containing protein [Methanosarcina sp.]
YKFDSVLLNVVRGDTETGYYNAAYNLVFSAVLISNVVNTALYPSLSRQSVGNPGSLLRIYEKVFRLLILISLPLAAGIWATAGKLIPFLYSTSYESSVIALKILIWVVPFMFTSEFLGYIVTIENKERLVARSVVISTCVNILANLILIPRFGYIGASLMTVLTEMVLVGQYVYLLRRQLAHMDLINIVIRPFLSALLMGVSVYLLTPWLSMIPLILTGIFVYFLSSIIFGAVSKDDLNLIRRLQPEAETEGN